MCFTEISLLFLPCPHWDNQGLGIVEDHQWSQWHWDHSLQTHITIKGRAVNKRKRNGGVSALHTNTADKTEAVFTPLPLNPPPHVHQSFNFVCNTYFHKEQNSLEYSWIHTLSVKTKILHHQRILQFLVDVECPIKLTQFWPYLSGESVSPHRWRISHTRALWLQIRIAMQVVSRAFDQWSLLQFY